MPYIICVNRPGYLPEQEPVAVATLEEARDEATNALAQHGIAAKGEGMRLWVPPLVTTAQTLPEQGGTVGPLPDGSVIDVQQVGIKELARLCDFTPSASDGGVVTADVVIDAYNAR